MRPEQTQNDCKSIIGFSLREILGCGPKFQFFPLTSICFAWLLLFSAHFVNGQNPLAGNQGFQILSEGDFTFTGYSHVHGALGVGGNLTLNCNGVLAEICMDGVSSYTFPGDGSTTTGLLVKGGVTWTNGGAKVLGGKYMHIGNSTGCIQSDNGTNMATQVLPTGGTYNQAKRIEGTLDQTPSPSPFQSVGFDFTSVFNNFRTTSQGLASCTNNVQLFNASNVAISGNNVSTAQNVQINSLANGVNVLNLTPAALNNITELKFNAGALPSATKLLVINVPLSANFVWNNSNMPGLSGSLHGSYVFWNFSGNTTYNLTVNTASLVIGTIFSPNHNLIKTGTGDIDGNLVAKSMTLGLGEIHLYPFNGNVPLCGTTEICTNGLDDDGDGLVDCEDTECQTSQTPIINLSATALANGVLPTWSNTGSLGGNFGSGTTNPVVETVAGRKAVTFDGTDVMLSSFNAPAGITGSGNFTVMVWAYNPVVANEESLLSWSYRGGGDGTNAHINCGSNPYYGAISHWGAPDMAYTTTPAAGVWNHFAITYAGGTGGVERVYVNGVLSNEEAKTLGIYANQPLHLGAARSASTGGSSLYFSGSIASVKVYDQDLTASNIASIYAQESGADCHELTNLSCSTSCQTGNSVANGDFSQGTTGWTASNGGLTIDPAGTTGNFLILNNANTASDFTIYQDIACTGNQEYLFTAGVGRHDPGTNAKVYLEFYSGNTFISKTSDVFANIVFGGSFGYIYPVKGLTPATATKVRIVGFANGTALKIDNISLRFCQGCSEICNNGLDDDADGFVDALDTECNTCAFVGQNLVANGEFDSGNTGFTSDYTFTPLASMCGNYGIFSVGKNISQVGNPIGCNNGIWAASDRNGPSGNFMLIDPSNATGVNDRIWSQTVAVCPNTNYVFSVWAKNMYYSEADWYSGIDPNFQFSINGAVMPGASFTMPRQILADSAKWIKVQGSWNSGSATSATLNVVNVIPGNEGNDLAIDGVYFGLCGKTSTISASGTNACSNSAVTLSASAQTTTSGWGFYEWLRNGVVIASGTTATTYSATTAGTYQLRCYITSNNSGCPQLSNPVVLTSTGCPEVCNNGLDDDGDGLIDSADPDCCTSLGNAVAVVRQTGVGNAANAVGAPNATAAELYEASDSLVLDMGSIIPVGGKYKLVWRRKASYTNTATADVIIEGGQTASAFTQNPTMASTTERTAYIQTIITANVPTRYLRLRIQTNTDDDVEIDAVQILACGPEICTNGVDDDGDGLVDTNDPDCGCSTPTLNLHAPTLLSGTAGAVGAVYRYNNVAAGTHANVTIVSRTHPDIVISNIDQDNTNGGYNAAFQPVIDYDYYNSNGTFDAAGDRSVRFRFDFIDATTGAPKPFADLNMSSVDLDGDNSFLREFIQASGYANYAVNTPTVLTLSGSLKALGSLQDFFMVSETAYETMITFGYNNVSSITLDYGANYAGGASGGLADSRMNCLYFKCYNLPVEVACQTVTAVRSMPISCANPYLMTSSATGSSGTCGIQWQQSTDNINWTNVAGATSSSYAPTSLSVTTHFRVSYNCTGNSTCGTVFSNVLTVNVQPPCVENCANGIDDDGDGLVDCADSNCAATAPAITASAGAICVGGSSTLTASGSGSFVWSTGATTAAITVAPAATTTYSVTLTSPSGCTATATRTVTVNSNPSASISGATSSCAGAVTSLTASGGTSYLWNTGVTTAVLSGVPTATATYTVTVTNASGCTASASQTVTVNPAPTANAGNDVTICSGASTTLNATGGTTYAWSNSLGAGATKVITPTTTTTYTVTVTNASGCTATDQVTVNVNASPTATGTANQTVCSGSQVALSVAASGGVTPYTYLWGNGLGTGTSATVTPISTTTYSVTVTGSNGCTATAQTNVTVSAVPVANAGADVAICTGAATTLTASGSGAPSPYTYAWSNGVTTASQTVSPAATTTYTVTVTSSNGCFATDQKIVTVQPCTEICNNNLDDDSDGLADCLDSDCGPSANAGADITICPSSPAFLSVGVTGGSAPYTYAWSNGLGAGATKTVTPVITTTYTVTVTSASGCTSTDQVKVTILPCSENCTNGIDDDADGLVDCADPDCSGVTAPVLADDSYTTCPGMTYSNRVTYNDVNLNNPAFSIAVNPVHGTVTIDWTGKFIYVPNGFECVTDYFTYQVCNLSSGCCEQAVVSITLGDTSLPLLTNVPADISINCDDAVPMAPTVTAFDECPGIFMDYDETSTQNYAGACGSYTITRTWTATDFCGNTVSDDQKITVLDQTKPEIFQVYTLPGGKNLIAGFAQRVTNQWKYVRFPVTFQVPPVVLASLSSNVDVSATTVQVRNVGMQGFEMRLREEEAADGAHGAENVSWIAVESGKHSGSLKWEAGTLANVNNSLDTLVFGQSYATAPLFFSSFLTNSQSDPATLRHSNLSGNGVEIFAQEETSADAEVASLNETVGYLAISTASPIVDNDGSVIGESGKLNLTNAWATVSLSRSYTKPVVIIGGLSNQDNQPVTIRTRNITANKFEVRLQEWGYLDGVHAAENVSWMVVEGSVPANRSFYCSGKGSKLKANINIFALDNCDDLVSFGYDADFDQSGEGLVSSQTWTAIDDCGNTTLISRFDTCQVAALSVKAIFHGATVGTNSNNMRDDLRAQEWVPAFEPYSEMPGFPMVDYAIHNMELDTASSNLSDPNVTICHKPGTAEQATLTVKQSELAAHLAHGDLIGACGSEGAGMVTICHKPGTPAQKSKVIPQSALLGHLGHGDIIGECGGNGNDVPGGAQSAQHRTIADGAWTSASTWESGNVPPLTNINNKTISIEHNVTILNSDLNLKLNSTLWITHGSLKMVNGNFIIGKSDVYIAESVFDGSTAGNIVLNETLAKLFITESVIKVGQSLNNLGGVLKMDHTCLEVSEDFLNQAGKDTLINVCAVIEGNFKNNSSAVCHTQNSKFRLTNGNFENNLGAKITGNGLVLLVENGSLTNLGTWNAMIDQYCVALTVPQLTAYLPATEICTNIASNFNPCNCHPEEDNEGGIINGGGNTFTSATEDDNSMNEGNSYGGGTILPEMLEVTGAEAIVDWALVEIRNAANEAEVLGYQSVVVKKNGDIVSEDGSPLLIFPGLEEGDYYVSIRHRNHLGQMTDTPVFLSISDPIMLDFTSASLPIRGGNAAGKLVNGKRTLWGGDFNGDGKVIYQGPYNDVFHLFSKVLGAPNNDSNLANYIVLGYEMQDFNMDGKVIYQGPNNDRSALLYYSILSHSGNSSLLANYIVLDMIP